MIKWLFGSQQSHSPEYTSATRRLTADELSRVEGALKKAAVHNQRIPPQAFKATLGLSGVPTVLADALYDTATEQSNDAEGGKDLSEDAFMIFLATCIKGQREQRMDLCVSSLATTQAKKDPRGSLQSFVAACIMWTMGNADPAASHDIAGALTTGCMQAFGSDARDKAAVKQGLHTWLKQMPALQQSLQSVLPSSAAALCHPHKPPQCVLPQLRFPYAARQPELKGCLLTREWLWLTAAWLTPDQADTWELLFNSNLHGASFNTFMGRVASRGPTLLLIKDKQGALFGGFALDSWAKNGQFYGQYGSFVFSLLPVVSVWRPTGINTNFLWCGQGFEQLPNGVGFGGQVGYYALSIDGSFDQGMSRPSATFSNTCLASSEVFQVDTVEVWLTKQPDESDLSAAAAKGGSALDRFKEDRHLMEMAGRSVQASRGYREAPPEDDL